MQELKAVPQAAAPTPHPHPSARPPRHARSARPRTMPVIEEIWSNTLNRLDFAFQPIVNIHTGYCFGYEALLRNHQEAGFNTIQDFFDTCWGKGILPQIETILHDKVLAKFTQLEHHARCKLFLNMDNRLLSAGFDAERMAELLEHYGLAEASVFFEVSERHPVGTANEAAGLLSQLKSCGAKLALDDFGTGFSGLQMLYFAEPDLIKIDRFFISDISTDSKKKLFLSKIVNIAHLLGALVVAEGVETEQEYFVCKDIGCDLVQGYLVQRPTGELPALRPHYPNIEALARRERRAQAGDQKMICERIEVVEPLCIDTEMREVFERFRADPSATFFPVVDRNGEPIGIVRERGLKEYTYSPFGKELIFNKAYGKRLSHFVSKCPIADLNAKAENILQAVSTTEHTQEGIIIVQDMKYLGFLSTRSLLQVINEKNLQAARDQNPLTKLPGNNLIHEYLSQALADRDGGYVLAYFDFDNFKPFNDKYGFRLGDRAILLFAELLAKRLRRENTFIGHIGGDDFFAGFRCADFEDCAAKVRDLIAAFGRDVESFYDEQARRDGYIEAQDREGHLRRLPLLGVSAVLLHLPRRRAAYTTEEIGWIIADLKKTAKVVETHLCTASVPREA